MFTTEIPTYCTVDTVCFQPCRSLIYRVTCCLHLHSIAVLSCPTSSYIQLSTSTCTPLSYIQLYSTVLAVFDCPTSSCTQLSTSSCTQLSYIQLYSTVLAVFDYPTSSCISCLISTQLYSYILHLSVLNCPISSCSQLPYTQLYSAILYLLALKLSYYQLYSAVLYLAVLRYPVAVTVLCVSPYLPMCPCTVTLRCLVHLLYTLQYLVLDAQWGGGRG